MMVVLLAMAPQGVSAQGAAPVRPGAVTGADSAVGVVAGRVVNDQTEQPLAGVEVRLRAWFGA
jgi:hypothetical protein